LGYFLSAANTHGNNILVPLSLDGQPAIDKMGFSKQEDDDAIKI
jgi:hypothetical protein